MKVPHFLTLFQLDRLHFISACRTGIVHVTWVRATVRLDRDEFRRLAWLLERVADIPPPTSLCDGEMSVSQYADEESEVRIGPVALFLSPDEFGQFVDAVQKGVERLDKILASGIWDAPEEEEPPATLDPTGRTPFSTN
jgi:hypothetical protein